ncbi:chitosanase [Staphylococcus capitis]|uniref:chitosanase n=1 Tax=Staphylococcus capitis TaxID=29388 RepID=UPI000649B09E|nr:chitosanase [Staphylococcus capitis]AKL93187.1 Chitosanase precursor [Staphylococcus capitis subsp. capitis]
MKDFKKGSVRKIVLGTSSALLATLIAANGTGLANAAENQNHDNHQKMTQQKSSKNKSNTQNKAATNDSSNIFANKQLRKTSLALVCAAEHTYYDYGKGYTDKPENIKDERGLTAGLTGFTTNGDDMKEFIDQYNKINPNNPLSKYTNAIHKVSGSDSIKGLNGADKAWEEAAKNDRENMIKAQKRVIASDYMEKAEKYAEKDGLKSKLSRYIYFDAIVKHGPGRNKDAKVKDWSFGDLRAHAQDGGVKTPAQGGDEKAYLKNFVGKRYDATNAENKYLKKQDLSFDSKNTTDRLRTQMELLNDNNMDLKLPIKYKINANHYKTLTQEKIDKLSDEDANFDGIWN